MGGFIVVDSEREKLIERERQELVALEAEFERTPRIVKLLRYLGDKHFAGETDQSTEYNIAIEVFERNPSTFIASEDAIVRVETYRLRKKLKAFYESTGKDHAIQVAIPPGSYSLVFYQITVESNPASVLAVKEVCDEISDKPIHTGEDFATVGHSEAEDSPEAVRSYPFWSKKRLLATALVAAVLLAIAGALTWMYGSRSSAAKGVENQPSSGTAEEINGVQGGEVRMILGYSGPPQRDSAGDVWQADHFHTGGWSTPQSIAYIARTSDPFLFHYGRFGDFDYAIPLKPGSYELHLYAISSAPSLEPEDSQGETVFDVTINGVTALDKFDPLSDAMGINIADERVIRGVSPASDGKLHLHVSTAIGTPSLRAIAILPGLTNKQLPIRLVMQNAPWTDSKGQVWHPDNYFLGGRRRLHSLPTAWAIDAGLYLSERYGHFSYAIPVDPRDRYTVILHFAELFFGAPESNTSGPGQRVFRILCNGSTLLDDFDLAREAGSMHPTTKTFTHLKPTAQGKLNLTFEPIKNYATVSAIEVLDEAN
jgi:hypothetical protein